ncbi:DNA-binding transcriptional MerR regulator [Lysinibacillus parviboronicapiens]|uniref:DNA-binding transcriptional MerR regulator n=1 Tax=Lysinibacillus parviboronicapiens TaxID=436516 RepID=A0ABV2PD72_9BACI
MLEISNAKEMVLEIVQHDPLFIVIQHTPLEEQLYSDVYLTHIHDKEHYSISEVANWFEITDAMLRYYIKPFEQYIFDNTTINPITNIRLNLSAILRLRMILLLKDEYRVKGLKHLLGIDEDGQLLKHQITATTLASTDELANKVDVLGNVLQQMMQTGLFDMQTSDKQGIFQISINQDFLAQNMQSLSTESNHQIIEIQKETADLKDENENLQKQILELQEGSVKDIVKKIRERHIENEIVSTLRTEALQQFSTHNKAGFFAKVFRSSQIDMEKEKFVVGYISQHLEERLEKALSAYYET